MYKGIEITDPDYIMTKSRTYPDENHYISTVPACARMYDSSSVEYQMYMSNYLSASTQFSDYMQNAYDTYVAN